MKLTTLYKLAKTTALDALGDVITGARSAMGAYDPTTAEMPIKKVLKRTKKTIESELTGKPVEIQ